MTNYKEIISDAMKRAAVSSPEKMRERKIGALTEIRERLAYYERRCYADELLCAIARKKAGFLLQATTVGTIREILKPSVRITTASSFTPAGITLRRRNSSAGARRRCEPR